MDFFGREISGESWPVTNDPLTFRNQEGPKINYSDSSISDGEFRIGPAGLMNATGIQAQKIECFETAVCKAIYCSEGDFPFDIFSAAFYLLSRYEEYLPHRLDGYGRYAHENSIAFREGFLHVPLVNIWIGELVQALRQKFAGFVPRSRTFHLLPTYDIDEAYAYKGKQWWRTAGGWMKSVAQGHWGDAAERVKVLKGWRADPYDSFEWMNQLHENYGLKPVYFFLLSTRTGRYDKNIPPARGEIQSLIRQHAALYTLGIHPSWQSGDDPGLREGELAELTRLAGRPIHHSRQHYIRFALPGTFRRLIELGIRNEYSMGYGSINGFRASVASPYYWYDLEREEQTNLLLFPFCFMDANSFYEQKFSAQQSLDELMQYYNAVKSVQGTMITIWHNQFLAAGRFREWRDIYEQFLSAVCS